MTVWPFKLKRWGNEYRIRKEEYGNGCIQFYVEKNMHKYGVWIPKFSADTQEDAAIIADREYKIWCDALVRKTQVVQS